MEIILRARSKRTKQKVERDHEWYDPHSKTMLRGRGGEMRFRYENGKTIPYLVDHEDWVWKNDYEDILRWVQKNSGSVSITDLAPGHYVLINIHPSELDTISYDLRKHDIMFDD